MKTLTLREKADMIKSDAWKIFNKTGLSPAQLLEQRNEMLEAILLFKDYVFKTRCYPEPPKYIKDKFNKIIEKAKLNPKI